MAMLSKQDALKLCKAISKHGTQLDTEIQKASVASVYYSVCHGDVTIGQRLLESLNSGIRKAAVVGFLEEFGQFEYKGTTVVYRQRTFEKDGETLVLLESPEKSEQYCDDIKVHWTGFKPERITSNYDCMDKVKSLLSKMEREIKAGHAVHTEIYDVIATAYNIYMEEHSEEDEKADDATGQPDVAAAAAAQGNVHDLQKTGTND